MDTVTIENSIVAMSGSAWTCEISGLDPVRAAIALRRQKGLVWLDSSTSESGLWSYLCCDPIDMVSTQPGDTTEALAKVHDWLNSASVKTKQNPESGFWGGVLGYLSYSAAFDLMPDLKSRHADTRPAAEFGLYDTVLAINHSTGSAHIRSRGLTSPSAEPNSTVAHQKIYRLLELLFKPQANPAGRAAVDWTHLTGKDDHMRRIKHAQNYILDGDIYQANLAQTFVAPINSERDAFDLYLQMRDVNPAPHGAWLDFGNRKIASTSPERLIACSTDGKAQARPIKGTSPRSSEPVEDLQLQNALLASEKDRAENIMIVDLLRNDLSRVCAPGSVKVPELCVLETFAGLHHLVSTVTGKLHKEFGPVDLLAAIFPGGSITGAPKHRSIEVIDELEAQSRGAFCGSLGYIGFDGAMDFNILIRTIEIIEDKAILMAGGGITILSDAGEEYAETLLKSERILSSGGRAEAAA
ncbi:MAG: aminodeoxychorismate synthase component I [Pseudomonadota bacterium]